MTLVQSTSLDPGLAAQYTGRMREDGLIVMLRDGVSRTFPFLCCLTRTVCIQKSQRGKELIRGYIHHGRNFVGRWRTTAPPAEASSWEGPFIMARRDD